MACKLIFMIIIPFINGNYGKDINMEVTEHPYIKHPEPNPQLQPLNYVEELRKYNLSPDTPFVFNHYQESNLTDPITVNKKGTLSEYLYEKKPIRRKPNTLPREFSNREMTNNRPLIPTKYDHTEQFEKRGGNSAQRLTNAFLKPDSHENNNFAPIKSKSKNRSFMEFNLDSRGAFQNSEKVRDFSSGVIDDSWEQDKESLFRPGQYDNNDSFKKTTKLPENRYGINNIRNIQLIRGNVNSKKNQDIYTDFNNRFENKASIYVSPEEEIIRNMDQKEDINQQIISQTSGLHAYFSQKEPGISNSYDIPVFTHKPSTPSQLPEPQKTNQLLTEQGTPNDVININDGQYHPEVHSYPYLQSNKNLHHSSISGKVSNSPFDEETFSGDSIKGYTTSERSSNRTLKIKHRKIYRTKLSSSEEILPDKSELKTSSPPPSPPPMPTLSPLASDE